MQKGKLNQNQKKEKLQAKNLGRQINSKTVDEVAWRTANRLDIVRVELVGDFISIWPNPLLHYIDTYYIPTVVTTISVAEINTNRGLTNRSGRITFQARRFTQRTSFAATHVTLHKRAV